MDLELDTVGVGGATPGVGGSTSSTDSNTTTGAPGGAPATDGSGGSGASGGVGGTAAGVGGDSSTESNTTTGTAGASTTTDGGGATTSNGGASATTGRDTASTTDGGTTGTGCPVTEDFLEPTFDGTASFSVPAAFGGIDGGWTPYGDETSTATITLLNDSVPGGMNLINCSASGFTGWGGCLMIFYEPLDLSASGFNALQFWARAPMTYEVRVNLGDSTSVYQAGLCDGTQNCLENCCHDHYGAKFTASTDWTQHTILFEDLTREDGNGPDLAFDPSYLREIGFRLAGGGDFELDIDELTFVACD